MASGVCYLPLHQNRFSFYELWIFRIQNVDFRDLIDGLCRISCVQDQIKWLSKCHTNRKKSKKNIINFRVAFSYKTPSTGNSKTSKKIVPLLKKIDNHYNSFYLAAPKASPYLPFLYQNHHRKIHYQRSFQSSHCLRHHSIDLNHQFHCHLRWAKNKRVDRYLNCFPSNPHFFLSIIGFCGGFSLSKDTHHLDENLLCHLLCQSRFHYPLDGIILFAICFVTIVFFRRSTTTFIFKTFKEGCSSVPNPPFSPAVFSLSYSSLLIVTLESNRLII